MPIVTKRDFLRLAGVATAAAALPGAMRAEGLIGAVSVQNEGSLPFALTTPMYVDQVSLRVIDLPMMAAFYESLLGMARIEDREDQVVLGAGGVRLLTLQKVAGLTRERGDSAGLYHVAYLLPSREDLARWLIHVAMMKIPLEGFADHSVSEAVYLQDPEGNGIEVYRDRPKDEWEWRDGFVTMGSKPLDLDAIIPLADVTADTYGAAPSTLRIGHIHLRVGDVAEAEAFYGDVIGLKATREGREGAAFYSSGGYHHHVAMNVWSSAGAGLRDLATTGLEWFSMKVGPEEMKSVMARREDAASVEGGISLKDPWGTEIRLVVA